jgi:hypothetical protein
MPPDSNSIVDGGFPEMSYTKWLPRTWLMIRFDTLPSNACSRRAHCAVMKPSVCTARMPTIQSYVRPSPITPTNLVGRDTANAWLVALYRTLGSKLWGLVPQLDIAELSVLPRLVGRLFMDHANSSGLCFATLKKKPLQIRGLVALITFQRRSDQPRNHSHSIVAGGFPEMSYTTRLMPRTSLMIRFDTLASSACGRCAHWAVMKSSVCTARSATTHS